MMFVRLMLSLGMIALLLLLSFPVISGISGLVQARNSAAEARYLHAKISQNYSGVDLQVKTQELKIDRLWRSLEAVNVKTGRWEQQIETFLKDGAEKRGLLLNDLTVGAPEIIDGENRFKTVIQIRADGEENSVRQFLSFVATSPASHTVERLSIKPHPREGSVLTMEITIGFYLEASGDHTP